MKKQALGLAALITVLTIIILWPMKAVVEDQMHEQSDTGAS